MQFPWPFPLLPVIRGAEANGPDEAAEPLLPDSAVCPRGWGGRWRPLARALNCTPEPLVWAAGSHEEVGFE